MSLLGYFAAASISNGDEKISSNPAENQLLEFIEKLNLDEMSPKEAMNCLYEAKNILEGEND